MNNKELPLEDYIPFKYDRFIMTRVEYLIYTQDEQAAKILRIIEWCIEQERKELYVEAKSKTTAGKEVIIPEIVWVPISHRFIMSQLHGTIQSETTVKEKIAELEKHHFVFRAPGNGGPYDPPLYTINKHLLHDLAQLLPPKLDQIDMGAVMKQQRNVTKVREGQKLTPSKIDPLVQKIRETIIAPLDPQLLALYSPKIDPLLSTRGGQKLPPKIYKEKQKEKKESNSVASGSQSPTLHAPIGDALTLNLSQEQLASLPEDQRTILLAAQRILQGTFAQGVENPLPVVDNSQGDNSQIVDTPSEQTALSLPDVSNTMPVHSPDPVCVEHPAQQPLPPEDALAAKGKRDGGRKKKAELTEEAKAILAAEKAKEEERLVRHRGIQARIDARRGFGLADSGEIVNERKYINKLMGSYNDAQIDRIHKFLFEEDPYWSDVTRRYDIGAYLIWKKAQSVAQILRQRREKQSGSGSGYTNYTHNRPADALGEGKQPALVTAFPPSTKDQAQQPVSAPEGGLTEEKPPRRLSLKRLSDLRKEREAQPIAVNH